MCFVCVCSYFFYVLVDQFFDIENGNRLRERSHVTSERFGGFEATSCGCVVQFVVSTRYIST